MIWGIMKVIFEDTRDFSMARNTRGFQLPILTLCVAMALSPAMAREADDVLAPQQAAASDNVAMMLIRPMQRPALTGETADVSRSETAAPLAIFTPQPADRGRIRQVWSIGVFR